jgi:drug/metabolite transporter (DMT)-like permease
MNKKYAGLLFLLGAVLCWGPSPVVSKLALAEIPQLSFGFLSRFLAFTIVFLLFFKKGAFKIEKEDLPKFILAGLLGAFFNVAFFLYGIKLTSASDAQAIFTIGPVVNAVFAHFILKEKIRTVQLTGVVIGFMGALVIGGKDFLTTGTFQIGSLWGDLLILMASISWVGYIIVSKELSHRYSAISITSYSFLVASIAFFPLAVIENLNGFAWINTVGFAGFFGIFYQGIFASVLAFLAYQTGLKMTSAFLAGVVLYLNPVVTTIFAVPILGEKISTPFIIGAGLIIIGSIVATQYDLVRHHVGRHLKKNK